MKWARLKLPGYQNKLSLAPMLSLSGPKDCSKLTGEQVQSVLNEQLEAAKQAASRLCVDPRCRFAHFSLVYQYWDCRHYIKDKTNEEMFELLVVLQLQLQCRPYQ